MTRFDSISSRTTVYYYDSSSAPAHVIVDPEFVTANNRLVKYEEFDPAWDDGESPVRTVRYVYWKTGDVANIVIKDEGVAPPEDADRYNWHRSLACYYTTSGQLGQVLWDRWLLDGEGNVNVHQKLAAREFRYDTPRARYMSRAVDPETWQPFEPADPNAAISHGEWTDYLGDQPWGDFSVSTPRVAGAPQPPVTGAVRRYLPGFGVQAVETIATSGPNRVTYFHGDLIRSNWATSETGEVAETTTAYTAFGENLAGTPGGPGGLDPETRYGFAGGWGYESGLITLDGAPGTAPITLQHLGARWYQPEIGRFVQRDPIGLLGGVNTYVYCYASPLSVTDASGHFPWIGTVIGGIIGGVVGGITGGIKGGISGAVGGAVGGAVTGGLIGSGVPIGAAAAAGGAAAGAVGAGLNSWLNGDSPGTIGGRAALGGFVGLICTGPFGVAGAHVGGLTGEILGSLSAGLAGGAGGVIIDVGITLINHVGSIPPRRIPEL